MLIVWNVTQMIISWLIVHFAIHFRLKSLMFCANIILSFCSSLHFFSVLTAVILFSVVLYFSLGNPCQQVQWRWCNAAAVWHDAQRIPTVCCIFCQTRKLLQRVCNCFITVEDVETFVEIFDNLQKKVESSQSFVLPMSLISAKLLFFTRQFSNT